MDVTLIRTSLYELPSTLRVDAIVHDGAADMQLWPGPGQDTDLREAYGTDLQRALDAELKQVPGRRLPDGGVIRVSRGRLHCQFLAWVATRPPELGMQREPAPKAEALREAVKNVLEFVSTRHVERVAFGALGGGPGELDRAERLAIIVRTAQAYQDACAAQGKNPGIEEVLVCERDTKVHQQAGRLVRDIARIKEPAAPAREAAPAPARKVAGSGGGARAAGSGSSGGKKRGGPRLDEAEVSRRRFTSEPYDMRKKYTQGDFLLHPRFGVGRVELVLPEGAVMVLFEDSEVRKMVHGRS